MPQLTNNIEDGSMVQLIFDADRAKFAGIKTINVRPGKVLNTHHGRVEHDDILHAEFGDTLQTSKGVDFRILRPTIAEATLSFPRGAAIIYPKDAAQIVQFGDIYAGQAVLECGLGSGALTCNLLRAVGETGSVTSIERRDDFAKTAISNIDNFFGGHPENWRLFEGEFSDFLSSNPEVFDRAILDMLDPWEYLEPLHAKLVRGAVIVIYLTTVPQILSVSKKFEELEDKYINIECTETIRRRWVLNELSIRPEHQGILHSGFILTARAV
ncbi:MAG: tRNA (adenine-N1)-methyltransferase [Candidatus Ancillula sp.]|jgi:tRNA (adenine57-N1/adenine58-N1)-methyltransferase|nr:tRNA (adenine-N1)-methyltransferase [Candidatus Ancillula sp.]